VTAARGKSRYLKTPSQNPPTTTPTVDFILPSSDTTGPDEKKNTMSLLDKVPGELKLYIGGWVLIITD